MKKCILLSLFLLTKFSILLAPDVKEIVIISSSPILYTEEWLNAIILTESGSKGRLATNPNEPQAVGLLQQWPVLVEDVNRILGVQKYTLDDRYNDTKAIQMFWIYQNYYNPTHNPEIMCRIWCGGPDGFKQDGTLAYYELVKTNLRKLLRTT